MNLPVAEPAPIAPPTEPELPAAVRARTWIVIAAFNEAGCIGTVVRELRALYPHVVVVDDGSGDATAQEAQLAGARVLRHFVNRGQGAALQTGISYALAKGADYVVTFDADGQHDMADLPGLLWPIVRGDVHICLGSRFLGKRSNMPLLRRLVVLGGVLFTRLTSRARLTDAHNGLRAFSRQAGLGLDLQLDRMAHASEIVDQFHNSGLPYREVPVHIRYTDYSLRKGQRSSAALRVALEYLVGRLTR
ncbi:MAG TPA: glycosyltransferase family 2 protein [Polyangiales bacterium]|nr:glycosyltransferase family 2 protein [Polyangiales bacterium]